jgi:hypothetical protein
VGIPQLAPPPGATDGRQPGRRTAPDRGGSRQQAPGCPGRGWAGATEAATGRAWGNAGHRAVRAATCAGSRVEAPGVAPQPRLLRERAAAAVDMEHTPVRPLLPRDPRPARAPPRPARRRPAAAGRCRQQPGDRRPATHACADELPTGGDADPPAAGGGRRPCRPRAWGPRGAAGDREDRDGVRAPRPAWPAHPGDRGPQAPAGAVAFSPAGTSRPCPRPDRAARRRPRPPDHGRRPGHGPKPRSPRRPRIAHRRLRAGDRRRVPPRPRRHLRGVRQTDPCTPLDRAHRHPLPARWAPSHHCHALWAPPAIRSR